MKHLTTIACLLFFVSMFSVQLVSAQLVQVRIGLPPPPVVVIERPACPSPDHVWVEGHWVYDSYTHRDIWIPGQWEYIAPRRYNQDDHHHGHGRDNAPGQKKKKYKRYDD